ncbi:MAG TPA: class I SAM-dependent methyltransferase [Acidobacteriaceae bacterium]
MSFDRQRHWENVYNAKFPEEMSWYESHLAISLEWISEAAPNLAAAIIDVGGGASTLVDDLCAKGYRSLAVLDVSPTALARSRQRMGRAADLIRWITGDVTACSLSHAAFDLWHDRAVFHFLTGQEKRDAYVQRVRSALKPAGQVLLATFSTHGPQSCSGLPVSRYDAASIQEQFGPDFRLTKSATVTHHTPAGGNQEFLYCRLARQ